MERKVKKIITIVISLSLIAQGAPVMQADVFLTPPGESELVVSAIEGVFKKERKQKYMMSLLLSSHASVSYDNHISLDALECINPLCAVFLRLKDMGIDGKKYSLKQISQILGISLAHAQLLESRAVNDLMAAVIEMQCMDEESGVANGCREFIKSRKTQLKTVNKKEFKRKAFFISRKARISAETKDQVLGLLAVSVEEIKYRRYVWQYLVREYFNISYFEPFDYPDLLVFNIDELLKKLNDIAAKSKKKNEIITALKICNLNYTSLAAKREKISGKSPWRPVVFADPNNRKNNSNNNNMLTRKDISVFVNNIHQKASLQAQSGLLTALTVPGSGLNDADIDSIRTSKALEEQWHVFKQAFWAASTAPFNSPERDEALQEIASMSRIIVFIPKDSKGLSLLYKNNGRVVKKDAFKQKIFAAYVTLENEGKNLRLTVIDLSCPHEPVYSAYYDRKEERLIELDEQFYRYIAGKKGPIPETMLPAVSNVKGRVQIYKKSIEIIIGKQYAFDEHGANRKVWIRLEPRRSNAAEVSVSFTPQYEPIGWYREPEERKGRLYMKPVMAPADSIGAGGFDLHRYYLSHQEGDESAVAVRYALDRIPVADNRTLKKIGIYHNGRIKQMFLGDEFPYDQAWLVNIPRAFPRRFDVCGIKNSSILSPLLLDQGEHNGTLRFDSYYYTGSKNPFFVDSYREVQRRWLGWDIENNETQPQPMMVNLKDRSHSEGFVLKEKISDGSIKDFNIYLFSKKAYKGRNHIAWVDFKKERVGSRYRKVLYAYLTDSKRRPYKLVYKGYFDSKKGHERFARINTDSSMLLEKDRFWIQWQAWHAMYGGLPSPFDINVEVRQQVLSMLQEKDWINLNDIKQMIDPAGAYTIDVIAPVVADLVKPKNGNGIPRIVRLGDRFFKAEPLTAGQDFSIYYNRRRYKSGSIHDKDQLLLLLEKDRVIAIINTSQGNKPVYMKIARNDDGAIHDLRRRSYRKGFFDDFSGTLENFQIISNKKEAFDVDQRIRIAETYELAYLPEDKFISLVIDNGEIQAAAYTVEYNHQPFIKDSSGAYVLREGINANRVITTLSDKRKKRIFMDERLYDSEKLMHAYTADGRLLAVNNNITSGILSKGIRLVDGIDSISKGERFFGAGFCVYCGNNVVTVVIKDGYIIRADQWESHVSNPYLIQHGPVSLRSDIGTKPVLSIKKLPQGTKHITDYTWLDLRMPFQLGENIQTGSEKTDRQLTGAQ